MKFKIIFMRKYLQRIKANLIYQMKEGNSKAQKPVFNVKDKPTNHINNNKIIILFTKIINKFNQRMRRSYLPQMRKIKFLKN